MLQLTIPNWNHLDHYIRTRIASASAAIIEAMKSSSGGIPFLEGKINYLPSFTFISYEAVDWLLEQVEGITTEQEAIDLMQTMLKERLICHSSGNNKLAMICHLIFCFFSFITFL